MPQHSLGGDIASVTPASLADDMGVRAGDRLLTVNGHVLRDVIDYQFHSADEQLQLRLRRGGTEMTLVTQRVYGRELGISFESPIFDSVRRCTNACEFCFVGQLPSDLRPSLYIKDDDYRLSFLSGTFVTLTNMTEADWRRLHQQRLSPLYVSVHATDPSLRRCIFGRDVPDIVQQLRRIGRLGIHVHTQVVLVPGLNDGEWLQRTVQELIQLHPIVESVAIVPVGLTKYHRGGCRVYTSREARKLLAEIEPLQRSLRARLGVGFLYPSDEWYLLAEEHVPLAETYDGFPQLENGVGLVRGLLDDWETTAERIPKACASERKSQVTLVCGTLIAPILSSVACGLSVMTGTKVRLVPVENRFFGSTVTVSGLLTGEDVIGALSARETCGDVVLPRAMFDAYGERSLDGWTVDRIGCQLRAKVWLAGDAEDLVQIACAHE
jgi:putative radical SAM enzyme (TIGR03279 family)